MLDEVPVDMLMFSVNPGYDDQKGEYAKGSVKKRSDMDRRCEAEGTGISVMKPFSGGQMPDASISPFGKALIKYQCMQYAPDGPSVLTVLPGVSSVQQVEELLGLFEAGGEEKMQNVTAEERKAILGDGNVTMVLSLNDPGSTASKKVKLRNENVGEKAPAAKTV